ILPELFQFSDSYLDSTTRHRVHISFDRLYHLVVWSCSSVAGKLGGRFLCAQNGSADFLGPISLVQFARNSCCWSGGHFAAPPLRRRTGGEKFCEFELGG